MNRLTQATHPQPANPAESFTYDPVGNRTSSHLATAQLHDVANRLLEDSNFTYTYDQNGNLASKTSKANGEVTTYTYDAENQLIRVDRPGIVAEYRYDALGRRIAKVVNGVSTRFVYDNEDLIAEVDASNIVPALYVHGPGIDEPLAMFRSMVGVSTFVFHPDGLGSITALTTSTGTLARSYTYDSFGRLVAQTGTVTNPYTYTGRELDPESGLYHYRARYYDPTIGRFLQEDPIGAIPKSPSNLNPFPYVSNNPIKYFDPVGLLNFLAGVGGSAVAPGGVEGSFGLVINPGLGEDLADIGIFGSIGAGGGVNVSGDVFVGFIRGNIKNVSGLTVNANLILGPLSVTFFTDPVSGEVIGGTAGIGPSALPAGASVAVSNTATLTLRDLLDLFFKKAGIVPACR